MAKIVSVENGSNAIMGASFQNDASLLYPTKSSQKQLMREYVLSSIQVKLPAFVVAYDSGTNIATVRIATKKKTTHKDDDGKFMDIDYPEYRVRVNQPLANADGGGIGIIFPITIGDTGWIESADCNCDSFFSDPSKIQDSSDDFGRFLFQYGCFTPCAWKPELDWKVLEEDKGCIAIRNTEGDMRITLNPKTKEIRVITPTKITCETPLVEMSGNLNVKGGIHSDGDTTAGTISLKNHVHGGVQGGSSTTGKPS